MNNFSQIGFDYGMKPYLIAVSDMEFSDLFIEAKCLGILYAFEKGNDGVDIPIGLYFLLKNEEPAKKFLDILLTWIEKSNNDGDAVAMDFIENNKGGYTIAISPEITRFTKRMIPTHFKNKVSPIIIEQFHFKGIDSLGRNYLNFKTNYNLSDRITIGYVLGSTTKIEKHSERYFKKMNFNFYTENNIPNNSLALCYKATQDISDFNPRDLPKPPKESIQDISKRRISEMKFLLPLTYNKLQNLWLGEIQKNMSVVYDTPIIKQAICNLTIFERLKNEKELLKEFSEEGYTMAILEYLLDTYESFDSYFPNDDFYTEERVLSQIINDKKELETYLSK
ncbi:MAG: hypothetical protein WBG43_03030 [Marinifilaceae bacterium]